MSFWRDTELATLTGVAVARRKCTDEIAKYIDGFQPRRQSGRSSRAEVASDVGQGTAARWRKAFRCRGEAVSVGSCRDFAQHGAKPFEILSAGSRNFADNLVVTTGMKLIGSGYRCPERPCKAVHGSIFKRHEVRKNITDIDGSSYGT
jgi:hypothetical protein